jgi:hypothetical protein
MKDIKMQPGYYRHNDYIYVATDHPQYHFINLNNPIATWSYPYGPFASQDHKPLEKIPSGTKIKIVAGQGNAGPNKRFEQTKIGQVYFPAAKSINNNVFWPWIRVWGNHGLILPTMAFMSDIGLQVKTINDISNIASFGTLFGYIPFEDESFEVIVP